MMRPSLIKFVLFIFLILTGSSCATTKEADYSSEEDKTYFGTRLAATAKVRFADLPVPVGFKLDEKKSFVFQTEGTRVVLLKYSGRAKLDNLVEFYREQMPLNNWELLNVVEYGRSILNFERPDQTCIVTIEPKGMSKIISISVAPKSKGGFTEKQNK